VKGLPLKECFGGELLQPLEGLRAALGQFSVLREELGEVLSLSSMCKLVPGWA